MQTWTDAALQQALAEGWGLLEVVDNGDRRPYFVIAGAGPLGTRFKNTQAASSFVIERARDGSALHQKALQFMMTSRLRRTKGQ